MERERVVVETVIVGPVGDCLWREEGGRVGREFEGGLVGREGDGGIFVD